MGAGAQTGNTQRKLNKTKKHWRRIDTTSSARRGNGWGCLIQTSSVDPRPKNKHVSFSDEKFRSADQRSERCTHTDYTHISSSAVKQSRLPTQLSLNNLLMRAWLFEQAKDRKCRRRPHLPGLKTFSMPMTMTAQTGTDKSITKCVQTQSLRALLRTGVISS